MCPLLASDDVYTYIITNTLVHTFLVTNLTAEERYEFSVYSTNEIGTNSPVGVANYTTKNIPSTPQGLFIYFFVIFFERFLR